MDNKINLRSLIFIHDFVILKLKLGEMEISKVCLIGVISFLLISTAIGDSLRNYEIKVGGQIRRGGSRRTPLSKGRDPITTPNSPFKPSTLDKPTTQNYGINYDIERLVPSGPSSIPFPQFVKLSTPIRRSGPRRTPLSKGKDPITYPDPPPKH